MLVGTLDFGDSKALENLREEIISLREHVRLHVKLEEKCIHPLLLDRVPGLSRELEEDHRNIDQKFDDLIICFDGIRGKPDFAKQGELVLEFYRAWSRFMSIYFMHIDKEEELVQPLLWELCTFEELIIAYKMFLASQTPKEMAEQMQMMLVATNLYERADILSQGRANAPPEMFQAVLKLAQQVLSQNDWTALKLKLGI